MATKREQRTVDLTRTNSLGEILFLTIHLSKWELGRQRGSSGNPYENAGWRLVEKKTAPKPEAVKIAPEKTLV